MMNRHTHRLVFVLLVASALGSPVAAQTAKWPSSTAPRALPAHDVAFPPYEVRSLPNGLQIVVVRHTEQPAVSLRMIVGAGAGQDPASTPGVAAMVSSLLDQGTVSLSAEQIADRIDSAGGQLDTGVGRDLSFAHVVVMRDSLSLAMDLLADVVRRAAFAPEEVERQRQQRLAALKVSYEDPEYLANVVFDRLVYGATPYGRPGNGTPESVARITRDDLVAFHHAYFVPNNCLLAVVGDVSTDEAMDAATKAFGTWERREVPAVTRAEPPGAVRRLVVVDKPDSVQTEIRVGQVGIARKSPDYMAVDLAIRILGGEGANRLHRVLRAERGLTYGVSADIETLKNGGEFVAQTNTRSPATCEALRLIVDEYSRMRREGVEDKELSDAKAYMTGHFPLTVETPDDIATQVLNVLFYGLSLDELQTYRQRVNAVTVDDVSRAAAKYLRPDRLSVVLVGNASAFLDRLKGTGFGNYEVVRLAELDLSAADFKKNGPERWSVSAQEPRGAPWPRDLRQPALVVRPAAFRPQASSVVQAPPSASAADIIRKAVVAKGGLEKLKAVKTVRATAVTTVMLPQGPARTETTTYIEYPDRFRVEARIPTGTVVQVYAGEDDVWVQDPAKGVMQPPDQVRRDFKASVQRDLIPLLIRAASGELTLKLVEEPGAGTDGISVVEVSGGDLEPLRLYVDATGLVVRQSYSVPGGGLADELFSDYRPVDGVKVAFKASVRRNNVVVIERAVTSFGINTPLQPGLFDRPSGSVQKQLPPAARAPVPPPPPAPAAPSPAPADAASAQPKSPSPTASAAVAPPPPRPSAAPADTRPPTAVPTAPRTDPGDKTARALIDKAIATKGGLERLRGVKSMRIEADSTELVGSNRVKFATTTYIQYPDKYRVETRGGGRTYLARMSGTTLELVTASGREVIDATGRRATQPAGSADAIYDRQGTALTFKESVAYLTFKASVERDPIVLLPRIVSGELQAHLFGPTVQAGTAGEQLVEITGGDVVPVVLGIDTASGEITRASYPVVAGSTEPWMDERFSDYRDVDGIRIPFQSSITQMNTPVRERRVKQVQINLALDPQLFYRPQ